jgi:hypothetical protein
LQREVGGSTLASGTPWSASRRDASIWRDRWASCMVLLGGNAARQYDTARECMQTGGLVRTAKFGAAVRCCCAQATFVCRASLPTHQLHAQRHVVLAIQHQHCRQ